MNKIFKFFGGRSTFFAFMFALAGIVLAFKGHLDGNYIALATVIHGWIVVRAVAEDKLNPTLQGFVSGNTSTTVNIPTVLPVIPVQPHA
jgi:hypothetical protein